MRSCKDERNSQSSSEASYDFEVEILTVAATTFRADLRISRPRHIDSDRKIPCSLLGDRSIPSQGPLVPLKKIDKVNRKTDRVILLHARL